MSASHASPIRQVENPELLRRLECLERLWKRFWGRSVSPKEVDITEEKTCAYFDLYKHKAALQILDRTVPRYLIVRQEYIEIYDALRDTETRMVARDNSDRPGAPMGVALTGQPGIGKTMFLVYALLRRLQSSEPVAIQTASDYFWLFSEDGVQHCSSSNSLDLGNATSPGTVIWALSNSSNRVEQPAEAFFDSPSTFVVQATSPKESRWKNWTTQHYSKKLVMDLWPENELMALARLVGYDPKQLLSLANKWGPSPRTLISMLEDPDEEELFDMKCQAAAEQLANNPGRMNDLSDIDAQNTPSSILFVRPRRKSDGSLDRREFVLWIPSEHIIFIIGSALRTVQAKHQAVFFTRLGSHPHSCTPAGFMFETWIHTRLNMLPTVPCIWKTLQPSDIPRNRSGIIIFGDNLRSVTGSTSFYWQPTVQNFPVIDSALYHQRTGTMYLFQSTISKKHKSATAGIEKFASLLPTKLRKSTKWRFIYVSPDEARLRGLLKDKAELVYNGEEVFIGGCVISLPYTEDAFKLPRYPVPIRDITDSEQRSNDKTTNDTILSEPQTTTTEFTPPRGRKRRADEIDSGKPPKKVKG